MNNFFNYEVAPQKIEQKRFQMIRSLTKLFDLDPEQQQVVMRIVHSIGVPEIAEQVKFSKNACRDGLAAIKNKATIFCDVEMVKQGLTKRMLKVNPQCFINDESVALLAKQTLETRSMAAISQWKPALQGSIVLIGNAPTALFRLLEVIQRTGVKPSLVIAMPVGFVGAAESKQTLWELHESLGIECITLLGREGGSAATAASFNALLRCIRGEYY